MKKLSTVLHEKLIVLRKLGKSIPEISRETGIAKTTIQRHIKGTIIPRRYLRALREKQGGAKERAQALRDNSKVEAVRRIGSLSKKDHLLLLIGLYWGEGAKKDFTVINSDPYLIQTLLLCLRELGIPKNRLSFALRVHSNISIVGAKKFWSRTTGLAEKTLGRIEVIDGKKKGKLPYGMCRIRVKNGIRERLLVQSAISFIGKKSQEKLLST